MSNTSNWSTPLLGCFADGITTECCISFFCFPYVACQTAKRYGECFCLPVLDGFGLIPPIAMSMRTSMRHRYNIEGNILGDCGASFCCCPCAWCQMTREMDIRQPK